MSRVYGVYAGGVAVCVAVPVLPEGGQESLRKARIDTLRVRLFKVGALIRHTTRRLCLHLALGWPYQDVPKGAIRDVGALRAAT